MADATTLSSYLTYHPEMIWMGLGAFLLILEVSAIPGIGMLFGGLAGLTLGGLIAFGAISRDISFYLQLAWFFGFTCVWAAVLWKPFMSMKKSQPDYHTIIGTHAEVTGADLRKGKTGKVKWSGTPMAARLREDSVHSDVKLGAEVWVYALDGTVLVVDMEKPNVQNSESGVQ